MLYYLFREVKLMLYPLKKKPLSPEHKKVKEPHIVITSKFGGSGGSNPILYSECSSLATKKQMSLPKPVVSGIFKE